MEGTPELYMEFLRKLRFSPKFRPFTIVLNSGERYRIQDHESFLVRARYIIVYASEDPLDIDFFTPDAISSFEFRRNGPRK